YQGDGELGNFSLAYQLGMVISFFYTSFNMAWTPTFYKWMDDNKYSKIKKVRLLVYSFLIASGLILFMIWWFLGSYFLTSKNYDVSSLTIFLLIVAFIFLSIYKFEGNYFFYYK